MGYLILFYLYFCRHNNIYKVQTKELPNVIFPRPRQCRDQNVTAKISVILETLGML